MPEHEGAVPGSRYRRWRVPWVGRTRAVAPCLLCEVLAVILVLRSGVALALALAWLLLRDCGSLGPRFLLPACGVVVACLLHTQEVPGSIPGQGSYLRQVSLY